VALPVKVTVIADGTPLGVLNAIFEELYTAHADQWITTLAELNTLLSSDIAEKVGTLTDNRVPVINGSGKLVDSTISDDGTIVTLEGGALSIKEITTPSADSGYGKFYTKTDNKAYFQDGAGVEHELAYV